MGSMHISSLSLLATGDDHAALTVCQHFPSEKCNGIKAMNMGKLIQVTVLV
jgi:hypothetical protein